MLSIAYVLPAQVTHEVKASAGTTFLKVVDLVSSVSDVIFFLKYDCWCHAAHKYLSGISPFVYRCWWIQKLSKRTIKWANHDGTPPLSQSPIVAPEKSFSSFGQEPFPPLKKEERKKKWGAVSPAVSSHPNPQAIMLLPRHDLLEDTVARTATALVETLSAKICFGSPSCKHARRLLQSCVCSRKWDGAYSLRRTTPR